MINVDKELGSRATMLADISNPTSTKIDQAAQKIRLWGAEGLCLQIVISKREARIMLFSSSITHHNKSLLWTLGNGMKSRNYAEYSEFRHMKKYFDILIHQKFEVILQPI